MRHKLDWLVPMVLLAGLGSIMLAGGCGAARDGLSASQQPELGGGTQPQAFPVRAVALAQSLRDLDALETPKGVRPELFARLKAELARVLREYYAGGPAEQAARKRASGLSPDQMDQAWCVSARNDTSGVVYLRWRGRHMGDYDLNGEVNIADITPLGLFFGERESLDADGLPLSNGQNEWKYQVDGDSNGEINLADVTPIGINFSSGYAGYRVYYGTSSDGQNFAWQTSYLPDPENASSPFSRPFNQDKSAGKVLLYTLSFTPPALNPGEKGYIKIVPFDGASEGTPAVIPAPTGPHAPYDCGLCHKPTDYSFRGTNATCSQCHTTPPEDAKSAWTAAPGMHGECMACHAQHGFAITPPESVCGACHAAIAAEIAPSGMTACLGCHQRPHLPLTATLTTDTCKGCHANPDADPGLDWASAPGQHGQCFSCHTRHTFKLAAPNSVCGSCHPTQAGGTHGGGSGNCLNCHLSPHVPTRDITAGKACTDCHPVPPDRPTKAWTDAPGLHAQCDQCHAGTHGTKPIPPESICTNCHATLMASHNPPGTSCIDCHSYYHVPDVASGNAACMQCHPTPPENMAAAWADVPGQHGECLTCHPGPHPDKPVPPQSVCGQCHAAIKTQADAAGMPECLGCHQAPHLPLTAPGPTQCQTCHPNPPEQPSASWASAPGLHNQCGQCHNSHTFALSWDDNQCRTCHPSGHPSLPEEHNTFSCKECHVRQHVPETNQAVICVTCHD